MSKGKRNIKTDKELCEASDALYYEIWMFNEMVKSLSTQPPQPRNPLYNALVESFVLHMRNLIEFFYPSDKVHPDTIIAAHYQNQWEKNIPPWLDDERTDAHKFLAHLTYDRIKNEKMWDYPKMSKHINAIFDEFYGKVPQERIGDKLRNYKVPHVKTTGSPALVSTGTACMNGIKVSRDMFARAHKKTLNQ